MASNAVRARALPWRVGPGSMAAGIATRLMEQGKLPAFAELAERFGAVSMTLEMPFKDNDDLPDAIYGWSPERCRQRYSLRLRLAYLTR